MRRRPKVALFVLATGALFAPTVGRAESPLATRLAFEASEGCPDASAFLARLQARAKVRLTSDPQAFRLQVALGVEPGGARGELSAGPLAGAEVREVTAASCAEVADALALIAALIVERVKQSRPEPAPAPAPAPARARATAPRAVNPRRSLSLGLSALANRPLASTPLTGASISMLLDARLSWWLSAAYARNDILAAPSSARLGFGGVTVGAGPSAFDLGRLLHFSAVLAARGGFISAEGVGVDVPLSVRRSYWALGLVSRIALDVTPWLGAFIEADAFVPVVERRFVTLAPERLAASTASFAPQLGLGLALRL